MRKKNNHFLWNQHNESNFCIEIWSGVLSKMVIRRTTSIILTGFLILFIFVGSYHSFCECYAQSCPIHAHAKPQSNLWILQAFSLDDIDQPPLISYLSLLEEGFVYSTGFFIPIKPRAPPNEAFLQIISSRCPG